MTTDTTPTAPAKAGREDDGIERVCATCESLIRGHDSLSGTVDPACEAGYALPEEGACRHWVASDLDLTIAGLTRERDAAVARAETAERREADANRIIAATRWAAITLASRLRWPEFRRGRGRDAPEHWCWRCEASGPCGPSRDLSPSGCVDCLVAHRLDVDAAYLAAPAGEEPTP